MRVAASMAMTGLLAACIPPMGGTPPAADPPPPAPVQPVAAPAPPPLAAPGDEGRSIAAEALAAVRPDLADDSEDIAAGWGDGPGPDEIMGTGAPGAPMEAGAALIAQGNWDEDAEAPRDPENGTGAQWRPTTETAAAEAPPVPSPARTDGDTPNIVAYALRTTHSVGEERYPRSALTLQSHNRNCANFANADRAQEEFLRRGGPERDPLNLDPDGDGFACAWSPEPFRAAARAED